MEEVQRVVAFVADLAAGAGLGAEKGKRLELAIEEWIVNVCKYSYPGAGGTVEVALHKGRGNLQVDIADEGLPFDLTATAEPDVAAPLAERQPGGLGLLVIRRMMDEVGYVRDGRRNIVTLTISTAQS